MYIFVVEVGIVNEHNIESSKFIFLFLPKLLLFKKDFEIWNIIMRVKKYIFFKYDITFYFENI